MQGAVNITHLGLGCEVCLFAAACGPAMMCRTHDLRQLRRMTPWHPQMWPDNAERLLRQSCGCLVPVTLVPTREPVPKPTQQTMSAGSTFMRASNLIGVESFPLQFSAQKQKHALRQCPSDAVGSTSGFGCVNIASDTNEAVQAESSCESFVDPHI